LILIYNSIKDFLPKIQHNTRGKNRKVVITDWVKAGSTPKKITSPPVGLLNQANDWKILVDLQSLLIFPVHIAKPPKGDRPDIVIYCNSLKIVIIIELTSPCEENFDNQHQRKTTKYQPLCDLIEENGWTCHFFAVEVGARGYCAKSVLSCFKRLGFPLKRSRQLMRDFALQAMKSSFKIWLTRDSFSWDVEPIQHPDANVSSPNSDVPVPPTSTVTDKDGPSIGRPPVSTVVSPARRTYTTRPVGLTNLGNTCYVNCILQALQVLPKFWLSIPSSSSLLKSFFLLMTLMKNGSSKLDPKSFVARLGSAMSKSSGKTFTVNNPQDATEVLQFLLAELCKESPDCYAASVSETITSSSCSSCSIEKIEAEFPSIISLPIAESFDKCLTNFLTPSPCSSSFCAVCNSVQDFHITRHFSKLARIICFHIDRRIAFQNSIITDDKRVVFHPTIMLTEGDSEVSIGVQYDLKAIINHSGSSQSGHYTAFVNRNSKWFLCNDSFVTECKISSCNPKHAIVLFFERH
jgi:ubiquitin C-terminal hydrolase